MAHTTLAAGELTLVVGDNAAGEDAMHEHQAGYNGIWSLTSVHAPQNCFVPAYAGLNFEHCMDALFMTDQQGDAFEPRHAAMTLHRDDATQATLTQQHTPLTGVSSRTIFKVREPWMIDMTFTATLHQAPRAGDQFGFFWASYLHAPDSPALYFMDARDRIVCLSPDQHGYQAGNTVCHRDCPQPTLGQPHRQYAPESLAHSLSARRFSVPLLFARPGDGSMLFLQMFDQTQCLRLCMSPKGGGATPGRRTLNPAWDFQLVHDHVTANATFALRSRLVYKPWQGLDEIDAIYDRWCEDLKQWPN